MTTATPLSSPARRSGASLVPMILLTVLAVAAGATAMWFITIHKPQVETEEQVAQRLLYMTGMNRPPANNTLDARFTDADQDGLADAPADAALLIDPDTIEFCYIAQEEGDYDQKWKAFCEHLSKATGKPVKYMACKSSDEQIKALHDGKLHVSGFNSGSVPMAVNLCGYIPVARVPTSEPGGTHIEIIVPVDSAIQSVSDFRNKKYTLAFTEPNSNTGYKAPMVLLHSEKGIDPERDYLFRTTGDHRTSIEGIAKKQYDAAAVSADVLAREEAQGKVRKSDYRAIYKSESFPSASIGYVYNLKPELAAKIREAILSFDMKGTGLEEEFAPASQTTFVLVNYKNDWALIRRIDDASGIRHELK